jgi:hypothetical protein
MRMRVGVFVFAQHVMIEPSRIMCSQLPARRSGYRLHHNNQRRFLGWTISFSFAEPISCSFGNERAPAFALANIASAMALRVSWLSLSAGICLQTTQVPPSC